MGMLDRYKKSGGFLQLLNLIETCGPEKQQKFLGMIQQEDATWSAAIQQKMLTIPKILSWPDETLAEIFSRVQELTLATALYGLGPEVKARLFKYFSHAQQRRIQDIMDEKNPSNAEVASTYTKIIEEVRQLVKDGYLKLEKIDPELGIPEDVEELLAKGELGVPGFEGVSSPTAEQPDESASTPVPTVATAGVNPSLASEITAMKKRLQLLTNENTQLKKELATLRSKLEQIKKIA